MGMGCERRCLHRAGGRKRHDLLAVGYVDNPDKMHIHLARQLAGRLVGQVASKAPAKQCAGIARRVVQNEPRAGLRYLGNTLSGPPVLSEGVADESEDRSVHSDLRRQIGILGGVAIGSWQAVQRNTRAFGHPPVQVHHLDIVR
ncbi:hypothetical protein D3C71_1578970 [compost metagenome]